MIIDFNGSVYGLGIFDFSGKSVVVTTTAARGCVHIEAELTAEVELSAELVCEVELAGEVC